MKYVLVTQTQETANCPPHRRQQSPVVPTVHIPAPLHIFIHIHEKKASALRISVWEQQGDSVLKRTASLENNQALSLKQVRLELKMQSEVQIQSRSYPVTLNT